MAQLMACSLDGPMLPLRLLSVLLLLLLQLLVCAPASLGVDVLLFFRAGRSS